MDHTLFRRSLLVDQGLSRNFTSLFLSEYDQKRGRFWQTAAGVGKDQPQQ